MKVWNLNHWTTKKFPELSSDQPKIRLLDVKDALYEPCANHKTKTYSRYTKDREKGIKAYHYAKSSIQNGRQQERKKGTKEILTGYKTIR